MQRLHEWKELHLPGEVCQRFFVKEQKSADVIVGRKRVLKTREVSQKTEGRNVRMAKKLGSPWPGANGRNTLANYLHEDRSETKSKMQEGSS